MNVATDIGAVYRNGLTLNDSIAAKALVVNFMDAVQSGRYADAVSNLYVLNAENPYKKPELLDNKKLEEAIEMMKKINPKSYEIKSMEFVTAVNNPIKCKILTVLPANNSEVELTWVLNPVNYMGKWLLCFAIK